LRQQSVDFLSQYARDGIAVGGVSVGESKELIREVVAFTASKLPTDKPRYLMGV
jgi:queuine tRNA-ribosyltransferase